MNNVLLKTIIVTEQNANIVKLDDIKIKTTKIKSEDVEINLSVLYSGNSIDNVCVKALR